MSTIQEVLRQRNQRADTAIKNCAASIADTAEYKSTIEHYDSALYRLLRAVYFQGREDGLKAASTAIETTTHRSDEEGG